MIKNNKSLILLFFFTLTPDQNQKQPPPCKLNTDCNLHLYTPGGDVCTRRDWKGNTLDSFFIYKLCFYTPFYPIFPQPFVCWNTDKSSHKHWPGRCEVCGGWRGRLGQADVFPWLLSPCFAHWRIAFIDPLLSDLPSLEAHLMSFSGSAFHPDIYKNVERTRNQLWLLYCSLIEITQKDKHELEPTSIILMGVTTCMRGLDPFHKNLQAYTKHHWGECTMKVV